MIVPPLEFIDDVRRVIDQEDHLATVEVRSADEYVRITAYFLWNHGYNADYKVMAPDDYVYQVYYVVAWMISTWAIR